MNTLSRHVMGTLNHLIDDHLFQNIGFLLGKCSQLKERFLDQYLVEEDITASQIKVLFTLRFIKIQRSSDVSRTLNMDNSSITRMLDRLEKKGLIKRSPDPEDRRSVLVELTEAGTEVTSRAIPLAEGAIDKLTECLTPEEKQSLQHCLLKIVDFHLQECHLYQRKGAKC